MSSSALRGWLASGWGEGDVGRSERLKDGKNGEERMRRQGCERRAGK